MDDPYFPPVDHAHPSSGLLAIGGDLSEARLLRAYRSGIFPWPLPDGTLAWFAPPQRAIIPLKFAKIPQSVRKARRQQTWAYLHNERPLEVLFGCQRAVRPNQSSTWITSNIISAYYHLHHLRIVHTFASILPPNQELAGGLYGLKIGRMFAGESMFYSKPNGSKVAFAFLIDYLKEQDCLFIDCQIMTPLVAQFGAILINRAEFMTILTESLS